jgi:uncharacterized protein (TIGR02996 family)
MPRRPKSSKPEAPYPPGWEPFLAAINANLDDDTPRLVFADWLQENGDEARAEFTRVQCELWRKHPGYAGDYDIVRRNFSEADRAAWKRERELERDNRARWAAGLPVWAQRHVAFRRGFLFHFTATARQWLKDGARNRALTPLENLELERVAGLEGELFRSPSLLGLHRLFLPDVTPDAATVLAGSPALDSLVGLSVGKTGGWSLDGPAAAALVSSPRLANLRRLWVRGNPVGDAVALALADNAHLRELEGLELFCVGLQPGPFARLVASPRVERVRVLNLQGNGLGVSGASAIAQSKLACVEELNLRYNGLTAEAARALAAWPGLRSVRVLRLSGNRFGPDGVCELLASPHLASLHTLELPALGVHKADRERIEATPEFRRIANVTFG